MKKDLVIEHRSCMSTDLSLKHNYLYQNLTCIAMGVSVAGIIAALICNLVFLKAVLGFLLGAFFFAASIVCQAVFMNKAFLSVEDAGIDEVSLSNYKRKVIGLAEKSIGLTVVFIGFTFPLIMVDAYAGLSFDSLLILGGMGAAAFLLNPDIKQILTCL